MSRSVAWVLAVFALLPAGLWLYLRAFQLPAPTGPYPVGTAILDVTDASRPDPYSTNPRARRELVVQLWYPARPSQKPFARYLRWREAGIAMFYGPLLHTHSRLEAPIAPGGPPFPVLLFSPRWNGQRTQNTVLAEELASHGYVVAAIDYPHNASRTELADGTVIKGNQALEGPKGAAATAAEQIAFWNATLELWAADERFLLDQLAARSGSNGDPFQGRLDTANAGAFGHSFGGAAALALCGRDPRIKAAINLDGWTFGGLQHRTAAQPIMVFYEGASRDREKQLKTSTDPGSVQDQLDRADFVTTEASLRQDGGYRLFAAGTQHMDFSDAPLLPPFRRPGYTGPTAPREAGAILSQAVLQFFESVFRGRSAPLLHPGQESFPELTVEHWPARKAAEPAPTTPSPYLRK